MSTEEKEGHRGGASRPKDGGSKREHHHLDPRMDGSRQSDYCCKDGSRDGKGVSRDKYVGRTKTENKHRDGNMQPKGNREARHKDSQPAAPVTQTFRSRHQQDADPKHKPWLKETVSGCGENRRGPQEQSRNRSRDGGLCSQPNPWKVAGANRQPPPPRTGLPVRHGAPVKALQRHWEASPACTTKPYPPGGSTSFDFSVLSYNILSQELLQDNVYLYQHCNPNVLSWDYRLPNLLSEIQKYNADILCLQEVQEDHYENQIKPALQAKGYQCEFKKRTGKKPDGCAVIFKTSRLSLLSSNPVEFFRPSDALLDRDNVGLVLLLQPNDGVARSDPSAFICVANTHLLYNPRRGDIKLAQLAILLAEIRRLSRLQDGSSNPVVLCGDLNSTPWSPLYSFLTTGCLEYQGMQIGMVSGQEWSPRNQRLLPSPLWSQSLGINHQCQYETKQPAESSSTGPAAVEGAISNLTVEDPETKAAAASNRGRIEHGLKLQSSYRHRLLPDGRPEITTCHSRTAMTVDYILYTPEPIVCPSHFGGRGLQLLGRLSLVGQPEVEEVKGLPNQQNSSDHLPLLARFRYRC